MPPKKNKGNRRGNPASRTAQPRTRRDGNPPAAGPAPSQSVPPGLTSAKKTPSGLVAAKAPDQNLPAGLLPTVDPGQAEYAKLPAARPPAPAGAQPAAPKRAAARAVARDERLSSRVGVRIARTTPRSVRRGRSQ